MEKQIDKTEMDCELKELKSVEIKLVEDEESDEMWKYLVNQHHYLGHKKIIGRQIKYLIYSNDRIMGAIGWKNAYRKIESRDKYIGWTYNERESNLGLIINNNRFLILDWIRVKHLASYVLGKNVKQVAKDWEEKYGQKPMLLETYVDSKQMGFRGTCYRASGWKHVGRTKGFTKQKEKYEYHGKEKEVYVYEIDKEQISKFHRDHTPLYRMPQEYKKEYHTMLIQKLDYNPRLIDWKEVKAEVKDVAKEAKEFHDQFREAFKCGEHEVLGTTYFKGLLSNIERKSIEPMALRYLDQSKVRNLQRFMKEQKWQDDIMLKKSQELLSQQIKSKAGMITVDPSEFPKKGKESVGVARQYCGNLGKVENCQCGIFIGYTSHLGFGLVDKDLYMPEDWFSEEYEQRRKDCWIPEDIDFKTKLDLAIKKLKEIKKSGLFPARWIGADCSFGCSFEFRDEVEKLGIYYFLNVKKDSLIWKRMPKLEKYTTYDEDGNPVQKQRIAADASKPLEVSELIKDPKINWKTVKLQEGAKGALYAKVCRIRVIECRDNLPNKSIWLFVRVDPDGTIKYFFSNAPKDTDFEEMKRACIMRYPLEQCFKEGKKYLGMDHYEHRSWPAWHRHMTYIFITHLFLLKLRMKFKKKFHP